MKLTKQGHLLLMKCLTEGAEIHFTKFQLGSGNFDYETEKVWDLTEIRQWEMDLPIVDLQITGTGLAQITAKLDNAEVVHGFRCTEHALIALDTDGSEIVYSYRFLGNRYDFIPAAGADIIKNLMLSEVCEIQDAENVTALIDLSVAYVSTEDFKAHINSTAPHPNTPTKLDDVQTTAEIWATDQDSHLHKISIENLRSVLKTEEPVKQSEQDKITAAQNELGLAANILMIEDFSGGDEVTDYFKSKVLSYAEHGNLLGIENPANLKTGENYILSDGVNSESVEISAVLKNLSGYYAKLKNPVANTFSTPNLYLYRTTPEPCAKHSAIWQGCNFEGVKANYSQVAVMDTDYLQITGDGVFDGEFLTLA